MRYSNYNLLETLLNEKCYEKNMTSFTKSFRYNDYKFYSYNLCLGEYDIDSETFILLGSSRSFNSFYSKTTSIHFERIVRGLQRHNLNFYILDRTTDNILNINGVKQINLKYDEKKYFNIVEVDENNKNIICPISLLEITDKIFKTSCNHQFSHLILEWFKSKKSCPLCRTKLKLFL